jgi:hypothetical protein
MSRIAAILDIPQDIACAFLTIFASIGTLAAMMAKAFIAQIPTPDATGQWSFYGVLLSAVIALALSLAWVLKWVATTWMSELRESRDVMRDIADAAKKQTESNMKVLELMEDFTKEFLRLGLDSAKNHNREM